MLYVCFLPLVSPARYCRFPVSISLVTSLLLFLIHHFTLSLLLLSSSCAGLVQYISGLIPPSALFFFISYLWAGPFWLLAFTASLLAYRAVSIGSGAGEDLSSVSSRPDLSFNSRSLRSRLTASIGCCSILSSLLSGLLSIRTFIMSPTRPSIFDQSGLTHSSINPSDALPFPSLITPSSTSTSDAPIFHFSSLPSSSHTQSPPPSSILPSLQTVLEDIRTELRSISDHLTHSKLSSPSPNQPLPLTVDSRHSIHADPIFDTLAERLLRVEADYQRLKLDLAVRSSMNNNNLLVSSSVQSPSSSVLVHPSVQLPSSQSYPVQSSSNPLSASHSASFSAFQPITKPLSSLLSNNVSPVSLQSNTVSPPTFTNYSIPPSFTTPSTLPVSVPPITSTSAQRTITPSAATSPSTLPIIPLLPVSSPNILPSPTFTMTLNNNLPTFKGLAHERPIQFITDFEIRATGLVGNNDLLLLQTVQQVLIDGALIWFGQLQKSLDRVTTWTDFKTRFYERYHTPAQLQLLRTELRLLFQRDNESTLDYFDRLRTLMIEIDPTCTENWIKHKFVQKLRSDIRTRLDTDVNLSLRDIVRKAQNIESNIEQQKVDEKVKSVVQQEKKNLPNPVTHNLSTSTNRSNNDLNCSVNTTFNHASAYTQRWAKYSKYSYSSTIFLVLVLVLVLGWSILVLVLEDQILEIFETIYF